jgi:predicted ATP-binding protein involved in virulence
MIEKIELKNYRCYEHLKLSFKKKTNVLIGDNSSGKTTILRAIRSVLSSFFTGYSDENTLFIGLSKSDFTVLESTSTLVNDTPINVNFDLLGLSAELVLNSIKSRTLRTPLKVLSKYGIELQKTLFDKELNQIKELPLFASFSTGDIHSIRKLPEKRFMKYSHKPSFGYYECMLGDGLFHYWTKRLLALKEGGKGNIELECVRQAIQCALGVNGCNIINDMEIRFIQEKVYYFFIDGREVVSDNLSDGYARLVNIVTDLAFRCALLNQGYYGVDACQKTSGTVLIDEIDLHLHPNLQALVLKGLQNAFPFLQFIVSTHAPMVMTSIKSNEENVIYKLIFTTEKGYEVNEVELYGMDASSIIDVVLDTTPRSKEVDEELKKLFYFIDEDQYEEANQLLAEMKLEFGDSLPELIKAESMINFLRTGND